MSNFNENQQLLVKILKGRQYDLQEITHLDIWTEDEMQANQKMEVVFSVELKDGWLKINNKEGNGSYGFVSIDGTNGVFRNSSPPVRNEDLFKFLKTYFINFETGERKTRIETAGPCDCLILDGKWRFFEFKTKAVTQDVNQADENRTKAEKQLARTLTFFREHAEDKNLPFNAACECIMVTRPTFPRLTSTNINQPIRFYAEFKAPFIEIQTDKVYSLT